MRVRRTEFSGTPEDVKLPGDQKNTFLPPDPLEPADHIVGPDSAPSTVIAYCDFQCPYCGEDFLMIKNLRLRLEHQLRFVYRHFPLTAKHPLAQQAAEAAEAAASQGRFWEMHDLLFENQEALEVADLHRYAEAAGLDIRRFSVDLHRRVHAPRVMRDVKSGGRCGITGTPTYFLNNAMIPDYGRLEDMVLRAA